LGAVREICGLLDDSLREQQSRMRVMELQQQLGESLRASLPEGLVMPHRRFLFDGGLDEIGHAAEADRGAPARLPRWVFLFNDVLISTAPSAGGGSGGGGDGRVVDCISLAKVQVKVMPELDDPDPQHGGAPSYPFELWSMARVCRFSATSEAERRRWADTIQQQVRRLLASFKQRGKSLAFLPHNVQVLRERLTYLHEEKESIEEQVLEMTTKMCDMDAAIQAEAKALAVGRGGGEGDVADGGAARRDRMLALEAEKASWQEVTNKCVEELVGLVDALEVTDEQHNDDSLIQYMLFSRS